MKTRHTQKAMTLIELVLALSISSVVLLAVGVVLMNNTNVWNQMCSRTQSEYNADRQGAVRVFEKFVRQASKGAITLAGDGSTLEVHYYQNSDDDSVNRYAKMYINGSNQLVFESGTLDPLEQTEIRVVSGNVLSCKFVQNGDSVQMFLTVQNGSLNKLVVASAVSHNN